MISAAHYNLMIIERSTTPQNDEAFIDGFTWSRVLFLLSKKR